MMLQDFKTLSIEVEDDNDDDDDDYVQRSLKQFGWNLYFNRCEIMAIHHITFWMNNAANGKKGPLLFSKNGTCICILIIVLHIASVVRNTLRNCFAKQLESDDDDDDHRHYSRCRWKCKCCILWKKCNEQNKICRKSKSEWAENRKERSGASLILE